MGNLYTHIVKKNNERISILFNLKCAYQCTPRDYKLINELKEKLRRYEENHKKIKQPKIQHSSFSWVLEKAESEPADKA